MTGTTQFSEAVSTTTRALAAHDSRGPRKESAAEDHRGRARRRGGAGRPRPPRSRSHQRSENPPHVLPLLPGVGPQGALVPGRREVGIMASIERAAAPSAPVTGLGAREGGICCPLCKTKLSVESHFVLQSTDGPVDCVKGCCGTGHRFACPVADLERHSGLEIPPRPQAATSRERRRGPDQQALPLRQLPPEMRAGELRPRQGGGSASVRRDHPRPRAGQTR
jgi:hypothetical protein